LVRPEHPAAILLIAAITIGTLFPGEALALRTHPRPQWMVGVGWGLGRGVFNQPGGDRQEYEDGGTPLIRVGRMLGSKAMVALNYSGWLVEFDQERLDTGAAAFSDEAGDSTIIKNRRSLQQLVLSLCWFPGNEDGVSGGVYLRAGAGMGWAGTNQVPITPGEPQGHGNRIDEWGWGVSAEAGYEFWIHTHATLGVGAFYDYMSVQENIVDDGWFTGASINLNVYF
jgi:hypothetical protein